MSWLNELLDQTKDYESPKQFWYWAGLAALSAVVKDKVWVERAGDLPVYLNIYVFLFAKSGFRKGPPIDLASRLVRKVANTRVIKGRSSVEAIIEELKEVATIDKGTKKTLLTESCGFIVASEFSSAIVRSEQALNVLTDLYDRKYNEGEYAIRLIRTGKNILKSPIITMLGGINEAHFQSFLEQKDIAGGFLGRTFVIHADGKNKVNSLMYDMESKISEDKLVEHLKIVENLKGPIKISDAGKQTYNAWYNDFYSTPIEDNTGTYERVGDSALKIAGLISMSKDTCVDLILTNDDIIAGITAAEKLIHSAKHVTFTMHEEESMSTLKKKILKILLKRQDHKISRQTLLQQLHGVMNADDLDKIGATLEQAGLVKMYMFGEHIVYEMSDETVKKLKHMTGKD